MAAWWHHKRQVLFPAQSGSPSFGDRHPQGLWGQKSSSGTKVIPSKGSEAAQAESTALGQSHQLNPVSCPGGTASHPTNSSAEQESWKTWLSFGEVELLTELFPSPRASKCLAPRWVLWRLIKAKHAFSLSLRSSANTATLCCFHLFPS